MKTIAIFMSVVLCVSAQHSDHFNTKHGSHQQSQGFGNQQQSQGFGNQQQSQGFGNQRDNFGASSSSAGSSSANDANVIQRTKEFVLTRKEPIVKNFYYTYSAPEEEPQSFDATPKVAYQPEERIRTLFIRVPGQYSFGSDATINLGNQIEEKTKVIVLIKEQGNVKNVDNIDIELPNSEPAKPEVLFVKYKDHKKYQGLDGVANIEVVGGGDVSEDELNAGIVEAGGLESIPSFGGSSNVQINRNVQVGSSGSSGFANAGSSGSSGFGNSGSSGFGNSGSSGALGGPGVVTVTRYVQSQQQ